VTLSATDLAALDEAVSAVEIRGERYAPEHLARIDR